MERFEELAYLSGLCLEASAWRLSEGDERDPLRIEVESRIKKLTESPDTTQEPPEVEVSFPKEVVQAMEAARLNEHLEKADTGCQVLPAFPQWGSQQETKVAPDKIKLTYNGRLLRLPRYMLEQVPCKNSHTGYKWEVKDEYRAEADAKVEQLDGGAK